MSKFSDTITKLQDSVICKAVAGFPDAFVARLVRHCAADEGLATDIVSAMLSTSLGIKNDAGSDKTATRKTAGAASAPKAKAEASAPVSRGTKRAPEALARLADDIEQFVKDNPGCAAESIAKHFGQKTPKLAPTMRKLVAAKKVTTKGQKRATRYFHADSGASDEGGGDTSVEIDEAEPEAAE